LLGLSLVLSCPGVALAQTDPDELARRHFESGAAYFEQAEYEAALREFRKAYELSQRPQILRNISVVEERLGNIAEAVVALDQYLDAAPNDPDVDTIRIRRDNLKKRLEQEEAAEPVPAPPPEKPEKPNPAPEPKSEPEAQNPPPNAEDIPPEDDEGPNLVPAYVLITVGGLAAVGSGVTGVLASQEHENLKTSCATEPNGCSDEQTSKGETLALTSTVLTGVAVLGVGIGAILWATADSKESTSSGAAPQLFVGVGPEGGYGRARWTF
jgi:tetratricopeptide (TPR) repeat protein